MKRLFITLVTAFVLTSPTMAQKTAGTADETLNRHDPKLISDIQATADDEIVAFSDTTMTAEENTAADTVDAADTGTSGNYTLDDVSDPIRLIAFLSGLGSVASALIAIIIAVACLIFMLSPVLILAMIIYFITRNRNKKYKIIENAIEKGQPIPAELLHKQNAESDRLWSKGIKNAAIGLGVSAFGLTINAKFFCGIGLIIFFYGAGQAVVARTSANKRRKEDDSDTYEDITDSNEFDGRE